MAMNRATPKYQATDVSSGQEVPKTASLSLTVLMVQYYCAYSSVRKFNDMDQTRCPMHLYFLLYGCT